VSTFAISAPLLTHCWCFWSSSYRTEWCLWASSYLSFLSRVSSSTKRGHRYGPVCPSVSHTVVKSARDHAVFTKRSPKSLIFGDVNTLRKFEGYHIQQNYFLQVAYSSFCSLKRLINLLKATV